MRAGSRSRRSSGLDPRSAGSALGLTQATVPPGHSGPVLSSMVLSSGLPPTAPTMTATAPPPPTVTLADIQAARARIHGRVRTSPCTYSRSLSELLDRQVYLKLENLQL